MTATDAIALPDLRDYQDRAEQALRDVVRRGGRPLLYLPTGGGKGVQIVHLACSGAKRGRRSLVIVPTREIALDLRGRFRSCGLEPRLLLGDEDEGDAESLVTIASIQTLAARGIRPEADIVLVDECHHVTSATHVDVLAAYPSAYVIGFTATPARKDGTALGNVHTHIVVGATVRELTALGFLVPCPVLAPSRRGQSLAASPVDAWTAHASGRKSVVFVQTVANAHEVCASFAARGVPAAVVSGEQPDDERADVLERFARGDLRVVVNVACLTEGWDCPSAEVCIIARGCGSVALYLQMVGRVLRPSPGKTSALLIDLKGAVHEHGLPDADRVFSLDGEPIRRGDENEATRQCAVCGFFALAWAGPCPRCGARAPAPPPPKVSPAELQRIKATVPEERKRADFERWDAVARRRGYARSYAAVKFKAVYGHWPSSGRAA